MVMLFCYFFSYYRLLLLFLLFLIYYSHYILSAFYGLIEAIATLFRLWLTILFREYSFLVRCFLSSFLIYSLKVVISNITWFTCIKMYYIYNTPSNYYTSIICFDYTCFESSLSLHYSDVFPLQDTCFQDFIYCFTTSSYYSRFITAIYVLQISLFHNTFLL